MRFYYPSLWLKLHYERFVTMNTKELKIRKIADIGVTPENMSATGLANIVTGPFQFGAVHNEYIKLFPKSYEFISAVHMIPDTRWGSPYRLDSGIKCSHRERSLPKYIIIAKDDAECHLLTAKRFKEAGYEYYFNGSGHTDPFNVTYNCKRKWKDSEGKKQEKNIIDQKVSIINITDINVIQGLYPNAWIITNSVHGGTWIDGPGPYAKTIDRLFFYRDRLY